MTPSLINLPLHSLMAVLRGEGFEIGTSVMLDVQRVVANVNEEHLKNAVELKFLLAPLICRNKEEQQKFYKIFENYLQTLNEQQISLSAVQDGATFTYKKWIGWAAAVLVTLIAVLLVVRNWPSKKEVISYGIVASENNDRKVFIKGDTVHFEVQYADTNKTKMYRTNWQIKGPGNYSNVFENANPVSTVLDSSGTYEAIASTYTTDGKLVKQDTSIIDLLCDIPPVVNIEGGLTDTATGAFAAQIVGAQSPASDYEFHWMVNDIAVPGDSTMTTKLLKANQPNVIKLKVDWTGKQLHCNTDSITTEMNLSPPVSLVVRGDENQPLVLRKNYNWPNMLMSIVGLLLLPVTAAGLVWWRLRKPKNRNDNKTSLDEKEEQKEYKGPFTIEFNSQQSRIMPEAGISLLAEVLRKRHTSDVFRLSINKTINSTIRRGGFPVLEYIPRTQPTDFLILIDKEFPDGHQAKLFGFVVERLKKEQVHLTVYTFSREPLLLSNEKLNHILLPIDKVARLYPETMLIIFSQADGFFKSYDVIIKSWVAEKFKSWNTRLIITPAAKKDWGAKELALYEAGFTVVPADINAHTIISDEINQMIDRQVLKKQIVPGAYGTKQFNFSRWRQVTAYLKTATSQNSDQLNQKVDQNLLEQWLCALAVYPHINWDVTIGIGKAFEDQFARPGQLVNYTNLLILSRIQWMNDEQLMDSLRVEMMNHLQPEKEALARSVIVSLVKEIQPLVGEESLVKEEMQFVETSNKFLLNVHDASTNTLTAEELQQFKTYVQTDQVDWALQHYLDKGENTMLCKQDDPAHRLTLQEHIEKLETGIAEEEPSEKLKPVRSLKDGLKKMAPVATLFFFVLLAYLVLNAAGKLKFVQPQQLTTIAFAAVNDSTSEAYPITSVELQIKGQTYPARSGEDSSLVIDELPLDDTGTIATLHASTTSGTITETFKLANARYIINTIPTPFKIDTTPNPKTNLPSALNEIWDVDDVFSIVAFNLKPSLFYYAGKGRIPAPKVQIIESALVETNTYRVILQSTPNALYEVVFVRNVSATNMQWLRCRANSFQTIDEARKANQSTCGDFKNSTVSYERSPIYNINSAAFEMELPLNSTTLNSTELQAFRVAQQKYSALPEDEKSNCVFSISLNGFYKFDRDVQQRQAAILRSNTRSAFSKAKIQYKPFNGNAFQRDYVEIIFSSSGAYEADCKRTFLSIKEAISVNPRVVCKLDLSNQYLKSIPKEVYSFTNLQQLNLSGNSITERELKSFQLRFPKTEIINQPENNPLEPVLKAALGEVKAAASKQ